MPRILILADDLSGAADCGLACVHAGLNTMVSLGAPLDCHEADVLCLDAHTRVLNADAAASRMRSLALEYAGDGATLLFKKIDSTLRGHLGAELAAVLEARRTVIPDAVAIMAPAYPSKGRTTVDGMHYVHGALLHETDVWKKDGAQGEARIAEMLRAFGLRVGLIDLATVRRSGKRVTIATNELAKVNDVVLCDAETDNDLDIIADMTAGFGEHAVWVGSAGLAQHVVKAARLAPAELLGPPVLPRTFGSALFVIGSASRTTKEQVAVLLSSVVIHSIVVPPVVLLDGPGGPHWKAFTMELSDATQKGEDVILVCGSEPEVPAADRPRLSEALGEMTSTLRGRVGALVASGGETARNVIGRWGVQTMNLRGELETGVSISSALIDGSRPLIVITKAGDFGQRSTLLHCLQWLTQARSS